MPPFKAIYINLTKLTLQWMLKATAFEIHVLQGCCRTSWTATGWFKGDWEQLDARLPVAIRPERALCPKKYACQAGAQISCCCCWCTHVFVLRPRHQQQEFCAPGWHGYLFNYLRACYPFPSITVVLHWNNYSDAYSLNLNVDAHAVNTD